MKVIGLFAGKLRPFGPRGQQSGIYKQPVDQVTVNELGIVNDVQADKRFHGGPQKALHQYSLSAYEQIAKQFPLMHKSIRPGIIGENLTTPELDEDNVCIGDVFQIGGVKVQVTSPRIPCWKISHKLNMPDLDKFIARRGICGWYYRVLEAGNIAMGDEVVRGERADTRVTIKEFMALVNDNNAALDALIQVASIDGLDPEWKERFQRRIDVRNDKTEMVGSEDYSV